jgi:hypothetical protein
MKKRIVPFTIALLMVWQVPTHSQEVHFQFEVTIDLIAVPLLASNDIDPPLEIHEQKMTLTSEHLEFNTFQSIQSLDEQLRTSNLLLPLKTTKGSINNEASMPSPLDFLRFSTVLGHSKFNKTVQLAIPSNASLRDHRLPTWINTKVPGSHLSDRMRLPENIGIRIGF